MILYECINLEKGVSIKKINTKLVKIILNHEMVSNTFFEEFKTRNGAKGIIYYDDFFKRLIIALENEGGI